MKIAFIGPSDRSIWAFRKGLIIQLKNKGHQVFVLCPYGEYVLKIKQLGARHLEVPFKRFLSPLNDIKCAFYLYKVFKKEKFDFIHNFTVKINLIGGLAGKIAGVNKIYSLVEGLGFGYPEGSELYKIFLRFFFLILNKLSCSLSSKVWFINSDDYNLFIKKRIIQRQKAILIRSVGVDINEFCEENISSDDIFRFKKELNIENSCIDIVITMIARMIWQKGVREFIESAKILLKKYSNIMFLLVGEIQPGSPNSVSVEYLKESECKNIRWLNYRNDIRNIIFLSDIIVLPSYYREGVPRCLLEGMALGKPLIASDFPGCREVIKNNINGILVPIKDPISLANAIEYMINNKDFMRNAGIYNRNWAVEEFDENKIVERVIKEIYEL